MDMKSRHLYQDLLVAVIQARMTMDAASARADILLDIFLITVEHLGTVESYIARCINHLELDLLDARDAPEPLRQATANTARAIWTYRMNATITTDQGVRDAFERWESVYSQHMGESPVDSYMDVQNARCLSEADYYSEPPLPFISRAQAKKGNQN